MGKHGRSSRKWGGRRSVSLPHICKEALVLHSVNTPENMTGVTRDFLTANEPFKVQLINPNRVGLLDVACVQGGGLNQPAPSRSPPKHCEKPKNFLIF